MNQAGNLFVADAANSRVLGYEGAFPVGPTMSGVARNPDGTPFTAGQVDVLLFLNGNLVDTQPTNTTDGRFEFNIPASGGDYAVFVGTGGQQAFIGATVTVSDGQPHMDIGIVKNAVTIRNHNAGATTNAVLASADSSKDPNIPYTVNAQGDLTISPGFTLDVQENYDPEGDLITPVLLIGTNATMTVGAGHTLELSSSKASFPPDRHIVDGTLELTAGDGTNVTTVKMGDHQQLVISQTGTLRTSPSAGGYSFSNNRFVHFDRSGASGGYSVHASGTLDIEYIKFDHLYGRSNNSSEITGGSVESAFTLSGGIAPLVRIRNLWFDNAVDPGPAPNGRFNRYVYLLGDINGDGITTGKSFNSGDSLVVFHKFRFDNSSQLANQSNIEKRAPGDTVNIIDSFGSLSGAIDGDPNDLDGDRGAGDPGLADIIFTTVALAKLLADNPGPHGNVPLGSSKDVTYTIVNSGGLPATALSVGNLTDPWGLTIDTCVATLDTGESCRAAVRFAPTKIAQFRNFLVITYHDGAYPAELVINVAGNGVAPANTRQVANAQTVSGDTAVPITIKLTGSDADSGDILKFIVTSIPTSGGLAEGAISIVALGHQLTGDVLTYTAQPGFTGIDNFGFKVDDGKEDSSVATVTVNVLECFSPTGIVKRGWTLIGWACNQPGDPAKIAANLGGLVRILQWDANSQSFIQSYRSDRPFNTLSQLTKWNGYWLFHQP